MSERFYQELFGSPGDGGDIVGKNIPRVDAPPKADGSPVFSADHKITNPLYVAPVLSPTPNGILKKIDFSKALSSKGVVSVLTSKDIPGEKKYGMMAKDQPVLVEDKYHSLQDVVALVAAESIEEAEIAASLVKLTFQDLPAIFDPIESMKKTSPTIHSEHPIAKENVLAHYKIRKGNVKKGFDDADVVIENSYKTQMIDHAYLEPDAGYVIPNPDGSITCTGPTQCPHMVRRVISPVLGLGQNEIQFISTHPGGGFGGKEETSIEIAMRAGLVALKTGRPVIYNYSREESLGAKAKRVPAIIHHKIGAKENGKIVAMEIKIYLNKGPYTAVGPGILKKLIIHSPGAYECENIKVDGFMIFTNSINTCAMRGLGVPQVHFAIESQIDELAKKLEIDPFQLRRINGFRVGSKTGTSQILKESVGFISCLDEAENSLLKHPREVSLNEDGFLYGRGVAGFWYSTGAAGPSDSCGAQVHVTDDGKVQVSVGIIELGQGSNTVLAQIAAEALGVNFKDVRMMPVDTDAMPESGFTAGSRSTTIPGNAICQAILEIREILAPVAADMLECSLEDMSFKGGKIFIKSTPNRFVNFGEVVKRALFLGKQINGHGWFSTGPLTFDPETGKGDPFMVYSYGVQVADVKVNPETGEVWVLNVTAAHDVGRAINPQGVIAQIQGGIEMGIGQALIEEVEVHEGKVLTPDFARYEIPVSSDTPEMNTIIVEEKNSTGPYGAKGVGESAMVPTLAAISNAVADAVGHRFYQLPIRPEDVALAIRNDSVFSN